MKLTIATPKAVRYACLNFHYAKAVPVSPLAYNVFNEKNEWCGVIIYSYGATPNIGKPFGLVQGEICELVRVALNGKQECTSQAVAMSLKQLHKDAPNVRLVVSYADCDQSHLGTIYQATNWIYTGVTDKGDLGAFIIHSGGKAKRVHRKSIHSRMVLIDGKMVHCPQTIAAVRQFIDPNAEVFFTQGKRKYLMPMDKRMKKQIAPLSKPYPKADADWHKIDREQFKKDKTNSNDKSL